MTFLWKVHLVRPSTRRTSPPRSHQRSHRRTGQSDHIDPLSTPARRGTRRRHGKRRRNLISSSLQITSLLVIPPSPTNFTAFLFHPRFWRNLWFYLSPSSPFFVTYPMIQRWLVVSLSLSYADAPQRRAGAASPHTRRRPRDRHSLRARRRRDAATPSRLAGVAQRLHRRARLPERPLGGLLHLQGIPRRRFQRPRRRRQRGSRHAGEHGQVGVFGTSDRRDAKLIVDTLAADFHLPLAAVHGTSIGVFVVSTLKTHAFPIYDRTFASMDTLVSHFVRRNDDSLPPRASAAAPRACLPSLEDGGGRHDRSEASRAAPLRPAR